MLMRSTEGTPMHFKTVRMWRCFNALVIISLVFSYHLRMSHNVRLSTFWEDTLSKGKLLISNGWRSCWDLKVQMTISLHFLGFILVLLHSAHWEMQSRSYCIREALLEQITSEIVMPSTYFQWFERNSIGPSFVSWATPAWPASILI